VVKDLTVKDDYGFTVGGNYGLIAFGEINDAQASGAERDDGRVVELLAIGTAMIERGSSVANPFRAGVAFQMRKSGDAAQSRRVLYRDWCL